MNIQMDSYIGVMAGFITGFATQQFPDHQVVPRLAQLTDPEHRRLQHPQFAGWINNTRTMDNCFMVTHAQDQQSRAVQVWLAHDPMAQPQPHIVMRFYSNPRFGMGFGNEDLRQEELAQVRHAAPLPMALQFGHTMAQDVYRWLMHQQLPQPGELQQRASFLY